jgi:hypothetical protein
MKLRDIVAIALGAAFVAAPIYAGAAQEGGTICGRVNAPANLIFQLSQMSTPGNVIIARSSTEEVQTTVHVDGSYCFKDLHPDLHTLTAFADSTGFERSVMPEPGQTVIVDLTGAAGGL